MKKTLPVFLASMLVLGHSVLAQNATTDPVGAIAYQPLALSDTMISLSLHREPAFEGSVASVSGGNVVALNGSPAWTTNQFVYAAGTQPNTYYALIGSGVLEGRFFKITASDSNSLTLDLGSDSLATLQQDDRISVIPYWTFGTVWPGGQGVSGSSLHGTRPTEILLYSGTNTGFNFSPAQTYYYYTGTLPGWRKIGGGGSTVRNDEIIPVGAFLIYRQNTAPSNSFTLAGSVQMAASTFKVGTKVAGLKQDNMVAFMVSSPMSLAASELVQSGAFEGSPSHGTRADELFVFNNAEVKKNKSPVSTYYYFTGSPAGWRKYGGGGSTVRDNDVVFEPGVAYMIRKKASAIPAEVVATTVPPYLE